ncbi:MAG: ABC transporter permease subunit [Gammaproteobacteria bacterium]|nr:ABC transporter permease subunit [Gammaproteobacteria bacterium]
MPQSSILQFTEQLTTNRSSRICLWILTLIVLLVWIGPQLSAYDTSTSDFSLILSVPDLVNGHWLGTDALGRDVFSRVLHGGRVSLLVGCVATLVSIAIGVPYGAIAGFYGGRIDALMMRVVDILYTMPFMFFVILLMVVFGRNIVLIFVAIGAVNWLDMARIVRGQTLSIKNQDYMTAAKVCGASQWVMIYRHVLPNLTGVVVVYATLNVPQVILIESFISFLGLGIQEPATSWGALINSGMRDMHRAPWVLIAPAVLLSLTVLCLNMIGDSLRDVLDVRQKTV